MKVNESGRSMIEMLGVLAIIGVLSVGGIAGYTKAMTQHKINKTVDQITHIVGNIRTLYFSQKNYSTVNCKSGGSGCTILYKGHVIPDEMWTDTGYTNMENPFGGAFEVGVGDKKSSDDSKAFVLKVSGLPAEACMALATYDWGSGSSSGLVAVSINADVATSPYALTTNCQGTNATQGNPGNVVACPKGKKTAVPMPADKAAVACGDGDDNYIQLKFY